MLFCFGVRLGIDDQHVRIRRIGYPKLIPVENIAIALLLSPQLHRNDVGPGSWLTHSERADMFS